MYCPVKQLKIKNVSIVFFFVFFSLFVDHICDFIPLTLTSTQRYEWMVFNTSTVAAASAAAVVHPVEWCTDTKYISTSHFVYKHIDVKLKFERNLKWKSPSHQHFFVESSLTGNRCYLIRFRHRSSYSLTQKQCASFIPFISFFFSIIDFWYLFYKFACL